MKVKLTLLLCLTTLIAFSQQSHADSLNLVVEEYYRLNVKIFQSGSTQNDIDSLFMLFTDDFTYVHPKYGGTYSRQDLYNGYSNNQKSGRYNSSVTNINVLSRITGLNAVTTEKQFVDASDGPGESQMTLFEFRNGKIMKITEYW